MRSSLAWVSSLSGSAGGAAVPAGLFVAPLPGVLLLLFSALVSERVTLDALAGLLARGVVGFFLDGVGRFVSDLLFLISLLSQFIETIPI
jgi:hypothetical protein